MVSHWLSVGQNRFTIGKAVLAKAFIAVGLAGTCFLSMGLPGQSQETIALKATPLPVALTQTGSRIVDGDFLRVGLSDQSMQNQEYPTARVSATGAFQIIDAASGKVLYSALPDPVGQASPIVTVSVAETGFSLAVNAKPIASHIAGPILVKPTGADGSRVNLPGITRYGRTPNYRGYFEIVRGRSSPRKLSVVNVLPLQDYLKAVVPNELPAKYGTEAIRAQAIAARNYALRPRDKVWPQFDICDSQYCQAYYGAQTETPSTSKALAETEGLVALYDGDIALALYSSASGGYGESYSNAFSDPITKQFPAPELPYLSGGPDIPLDKTLFPTAKDLSSEAAAKQFWTRSDISSFDVNSPNYRWTRTYTRPQLEALLNLNLRQVSKDRLTQDFVQPKLAPNGSIGTLKSMKVTRRGVSGKAMAVEIQGSNGTWTVQKEFVIRKVLKQNDRMLPSANIVITPTAAANGALASIKIQGGGLGHGVGMSQLGASWMHFHGYGYVDIIRHYYNGVSLASIPLTVGDAPPPMVNGRPALRADVKTEPSTSLRGIEHSFYVKDIGMATLVVTAQSSTQPIYFALNGKSYSLALTGGMANRIGKAPEYRLPIGGLLKENTLNSLALFPDPTQPQRSVRAWVELYPAKPQAQKLAAAKLRRAY